MRWENLIPWLEKRELAVFLIPFGWLVLTGLSGAW